MKYLYFLIAFFIFGAASLPRGFAEDVSGDFSFGATLFVPFGKSASIQARAFQGYNTKKDFEFSPRWGGEVFLFKNTFPFRFRAGNISFSQSASLLKNPSPSTSTSPLKTAFSLGAGIKSSLPSSQGATETISYFADFSAPLGKGSDKAEPPVVKTQALFTGDENFYGAAGLEVPFSRFSGFAFAFTGASAEIGSESATLKKASASFHSKRIFSFCEENIFYSPIFKAKFTFGATQTPWKDSTLAILANSTIGRSEAWAVWFRGGFRLNFRRFVFDAEGFYAPFYDSVGNTPKGAVLVGTSSEILRTIATVSANPQLAFSSSKLGDFKVGASAMLQDKITSNDKPARLGLLKTAAALSHSKRLASKSTIASKLSFSANNILLSGTPNPASSAPTKTLNWSLDFSLSQKLFRSDLDFSVTQYPAMTETSSEKIELKAGVDFAPGVKRLFKYSFDWNATFKETEKTTETFSFGTTLKIPIKMLTLKGSARLVIAVR